MKKEQTEKRSLESIISERVAEECLTFGSIDPMSRICQFCKDTRLCVEYSAALPKAEKSVQSRGEKNWIGLSDDSIEMLAIYQTISDHLTGTNRPMKKNSKDGLISYVNAPWNRSATTIYEYRNKLVEHGLACKDAHGKSFTILFSEFAPDLLQSVQEKIESLTVEGLLL